MSIKRPKSKTEIPDHAKLIRKGETADEYVWQERNEVGETLILKKLRRPDIVQVIPVTIGGKVLILKLELPSNKFEYRLLEMEFKIGSGVVKQAKTLLNKAGIKAKNLNLITKGHPFDSDKHPLDCAVYMFVSKPISILKKPSLDYLVPYTIQKISIDIFIDYANAGKIINDHGMLRRVKNLKKYFMS